MVCATKDVALTQNDLNRLTHWQKDWLLSFNTKDNKCKVLHLGKHNPKHVYYLDQVQLPETNTEKDLGVLVDSDLNWTQHIQKSISKARSLIGWTCRNVISRDKDVLLNIYKNLVRPHLEYCTQLWNPVAKFGKWKIIMDIERVQREFTRLIENIGLLPYRQRLNELQLTTLIERRMRGDLIETYKIINGINNYGNDLYKVSRSGANLLYNSSLKSYKSDFLPNRVLPYWNKLPTALKFSDSIKKFKVNLESYKKLNQKSTQGNYWELSNEIFSRINDDNRDSYVNYMLNNPDVMKRRKITINV